MTDPRVQLELQQLRQQLQATEEWAEGLYLLLTTVLPALLRGHPQAAALGDQLHRMAATYERLRAHASQAPDEDGVAGHYEPAKMLYQQLALLGVWPGVDPKAVAAQTLARHGVQPQQPADPLASG